MTERNNMEASTLCETCSDIDFEALFAPFSNEEESQDPAISASCARHVTVAIDDSNVVHCSFCKVVCQMLGDYLVSLYPPRAIKVILSALPGSWYFKPRHMDIVEDIRSRPTEDGWALVVVRPRPNGFDEFDVVKLIEEGFLLCRISAGGGVDNNNNLVQLIHRDRVNFNLVSNCLELCERYHDCQKKTHSESIPLLSLIDCQTRRVIKADGGERFIALSYVWGKEEAQSDMSEEICENSTGDLRQLPVKLPHVIEDAIVVALTLGRKYLWVDRYCIDQYEESNKLVQILNMNKIYGRAELTIIAAAGNGPGDGLCGIGRTLREAQPRVIINGHVYVHLQSTPCGSDDLEKMGEWVQRAWTLQEVYLSKRRLYFGDKQVLYQCNEMTGLESVRVPIAQPYRWHSRRTRGQMYPTTDLKLPYCVDDIISEYSRRSLSFESDRLNAISGLLKQWSRPKAGRWTYWGLPLVDHSHVHRQDTLNEAFVRALRWSRSPWEPSLYSAPPFPSWSWLRSNGKIDYMIGLVPRTEGLIRDNIYGMVVSVVKLDGKVTRIQDFENDGGLVLDMRHWAHEIHLDCWTATIGPLQRHDALHPDKTEIVKQRYYGKLLGSSGVIGSGQSSFDDTPYYLPLFNSKTGERRDCGFYPDCGYANGEVDDRTHRLLTGKFNCIVLEDWTGVRLGLVIETGHSGLNKRVGVLWLDPPRMKDAGFAKDSGLDVDIGDFLPLEWKSIRLS